VRRREEHAGGTSLKVEGEVIGVGAERQAGETGGAASPGLALKSDWMRAAEAAQR